MENHLVERCAVILFAKNFFSARFQKRKFLNFFQTDLTFPIAHCLYNIDAHFLRKCMIGLFVA